MSRGCWRLSASVIIVLAVLAAAAQEAPTFRSQIDLVEITVVASDQRGAPIADLTESDFRVIEDGRSQPIAGFAEVRLAPPRGSPPAALTDVATNTGPRGRVYALVLDEYHNARGQTAAIKAAVQAFVDRATGPDDYVAVFHTAGAADANQLFTHDRRLVARAIDRFAGQRNDLFASRPGTGSPDDAVAPASDDGALAARVQARAAMDVLRQAADGMRLVRGRRKSIVWFSEGLSDDSAAARDDAVQAALGAAARADAAIYAVDPRAILRTGAADRSGRASLELLASQTGGFAAAEADDLTSVVDRIALDNSSYYVIGYQPANERRDGRLHGIEVAVSRAGVAIRSRKAYAATPAVAPSARVNEVLGSFLPVPDFPLTAHALAFRDTAQQAGALIFIDVPPEYFRRTSDAASLDVAIAAVDARDRTAAAVRHTYSMTLEPERRASARELGMRLVSQIALPAGRYQLRVAAADADLQLSGSVVADLEVPDFSKAPLSMSHVAVFAWPFAGSAPTVGTPAPLLDAFPWPPTLRRTFSTGETLALFGELYESRGRASGGIDITATVVGADGRAAVSRRESLAADAPRGHRGELGFQSKIPLAGLSPGPYVVRIEARSTRANASAVREFPVTVSGR